MSDASRERMLELLAERACEGLDEQREAELQRLVEEHSFDADAYERSVAAMHLALLEGDLEAMPADLERRLRADAQSWLGASEPESTGSRSNIFLHPAVAWTIAAAALVLLVFRFLEDPRPSEELSITSLVARCPDLLRISWTRTEDRAAGDAAGEVLWCPEADEGLMVFRGLPANDPSRFQYQLWIFDRDRDDGPPVDGGVFDVGSEGEALVAIDAKLRIGDASLFAVTMEPPGGVVVSSQEHILLTATVP